MVAAAALAHHGLLEPVTRALGPRVPIAARVRCDPARGGRHATGRTSTEAPPASPAPPISPAIRHTGPRLAVLGDAHAGPHRAGPGVVGGQRERHGAELAQQVAHHVGLGVDRRGRVEGVAQPVGARRARHELGDPQRPGRRPGARVEVRLLAQLGRQQRRRHAPARSRPAQRGRVGRGDEGRHAAADHPDRPRPGTQRVAIVVAVRLPDPRRHAPVFVVRLSRNGPRVGLSRPVTRRRRDALGQCPRRRPSPFVRPQAEVPRRT